MFSEPTIEGAERVSRKKPPITQFLKMAKRLRYLNLSKNIIGV